MSVDVIPRHPDERVAAARTPEEQREHERKEVAKHYEHDADLFKMVLDRRLAYSTAVFVNDGEDVEVAQERKYARIAAKLDLRPGEKLLDVGCGWGSNLLYLAQHTQAECHGLTLASKQREEALARAREWGVADRVRIDLEHVESFKPAPGTYDAVLFCGSIVHMHNREAIHRAVGEWLKPGGRLLISDCYYPEVARGDRESAATRYIFVTVLGYCRLLSLSEELAMIEKAGLDITHVEDLTSSYVKTLGAWIDRIRARREEIDARAPGFAGVLQRYMTVAKLSFAKRTAIEYMVLAVKGRPRQNYGVWPIPAGAR